MSGGILAVSSPLLDPSKACAIPVCIPLYLLWLHGVGYGDFLKSAQCELGEPEGRNSNYFVFSFSV